MKCISLTQPWATLVAIGAKTIETRSWNTAYRGDIAIHAAKGFPSFAKDLAQSQRFQSALAGRPLPLGKVVAITRLIAVEPIDLYFGLGEYRDRFKQEEYFGDYTAGRFAWMFGEVDELAEPIPAKGALGLWEWTRPSDRT